MRRRDATDQSLDTNRWCTPWPLAVSALLHVAALAGLAAVAVARLDYRPLIPISLRGDNGGAPHGAEASPGRPADQMPAIVAPPLPERQAKRRVDAPPARSRQKLRHSLVVAQQIPLPAQAATGGSAPNAAMADSSAAVGGANAGNGTGRSDGNDAGDGTDVRALCVYCPAPVYPYLARARGWEGNVDVGLEVTGDGSVRDARVRRSSGHRVLDDVAIAVARRSRFAVLNAEAQVVSGRIEYRFRLTAE